MIKFEYSKISRLEYRAQKGRPSMRQCCNSGEKERPGKAERSELREVNGFKGHLGDGRKIKGNR